MSAQGILPLDEFAPMAAASIVNEDLIAAGEKMAQETVFFEFHSSRPGFTKAIAPSVFVQKIREAEQESLTPEQEVLLSQYKASIQQTPNPKGGTTDTTLLHVSQDILDRKAISKILNHDDKFTAWLKFISIPCPVRFRGAYLVSHKRVEEIELKVEEYLVQRIVLIKNFKDDYLNLKEQAKIRRFPFYNEADYPAWELIEEQYTAEFNWISFNVPKALEAINSAIYKKAKEKAKLKWADAVEEAREAQRVALQTLLDNVVGMLGKDDEGKQKKFKPTAVKKLNDFLNMFQEMNLTGDLQLEEIVNKTKDVMNGIEVDSLRKDVSLRETMLAKVNEVKDYASTLVTVRERKVVFEDEPEEEVLSLEE